MPPEAGYYVGYRIVEALAEKHSLAPLTRLKAEEVFRLVDAGLARLTEER